METFYLFYMSPDMSNTKWYNIYDDVFYRHNFYIYLQLDKFFGKNTRNFWKFGIHERQRGRYKIGQSPPKRFSKICFLIYYWNLKIKQFINNWTDCWVVVEHTYTCSSVSKCISVISVS